MKRLSDCCHDNEQLNGIMKNSSHRITIDIFFIGKRTMKRSESFHLDLHRKKQFEDELETIRARSRLIWSRPDVSLTTHGYFYADPEQKDRTALRPTSVTRRNNPHPKL